MRTLYILYDVHYKIYAVHYKIYAVHYLMYAEHNLMYAEHNLMYAEHNLMCVVHYKMILCLTNQIRIMKWNSEKNIDKIKYLIKTVNTIIHIYITSNLIYI